MTNFDTEILSGSIKKILPTLSPLQRRLISVLIFVFAVCFRLKCYSGISVEL